MKRKLALALDELSVESFETQGMQAARGTVRANVCTDACTEVSCSVDPTCGIAISPSTTEGDSGAVAAIARTQLCQNTYEFCCA